MWWDAAADMLGGIVRGTGGDLYTATAYFTGADELPGRPGPGQFQHGQFQHGQCSCPEGFNCKHVAALILMAADETTAAAGSSAPQSAAGPGGIPRPAGDSGAWAQSLDSLLDSRPPAAAGRPGDTPLAIELTLAARTPAPARSRAGPPARPAVQLAARLVAPGKNGGWIGGALNWAKLDSLRYSGGYRAAHLRLLQELYAVYKARDDRPAYYYYSNDKSLNLAEFESRQLWPLLDEADAIGLQLVRARKLGPLRHDRTAEICLDVTGDERTGLAIAPLIRVDEADGGVAPVLFIGTEGHGVVCADRAQARRGGDPADWLFQLARLRRPVPPELQRMALAGQRLEVPPGADARFRAEYYPRLRQAAPVISSDGSFTPPEISDPTLMLHASYGPGHELALTWEWAYQVGDTRQYASLQPDPAAAGYRDTAAEQMILAALELPLGQFGLLRGEPGPAAAPLDLLPAAELGGTDTMRFSTEVLPLLACQPGVAVEVTGAAPHYREAGDSLRIGVSAGEVAGDTDWFDLGVTIFVEGRPVPFTDVFMALSRGESHLLLADGAYFSLQKPELQALARLIEEARALQDSPGGPLRISRFQAGLWDELAQLGVVGHQAAAWQEQVQGLLALGEVGQAQPPAAVQALLRPYQLSGFQWLAFLWEHQLGGILADDMGLGKTLQTLALICHARAAEPAAPPFLIVAPTSVVANWAAESARFTPGLNVVPVTDTVARRGQPLSAIAAGADAIVTSYTLLRIDFDTYSALPWAGLILDEAQFAKNHQSKIYQCARRLSAPVKIAITGTPMENNLMELWSLLSITAPGLFPNPARFSDYYGRPIEKQGNAELLAQLKRRIRPLVLRRVKEHVAADLPAKQEQVVEVELHPRHRKIYQTQLQRERQKVLGLIGDMNANRFAIFRSLTLLRQLSLHAGLIDDAYADVPSSKIDALLGQLQDVIGGGHRALVFSQFTGFLALVRAQLDAAGIPYCYLDGKTRDRPAVLQAFKNGPAPVFLISLKAGGFGLNLTEADYCFLLDPWWNPATEAQAVDRTHRIGQTRNVMVYRLIAAGTIEEKVMALKKRKAELFTSVLDSGDVFGAGLDADDIRGLFA